MKDAVTLELLRRCSRHLNRRLPAIPSNRALAATIDNYLSGLAEPTPEPNLPEAIARMQAADLPNLSVERGEKAVRLHPDGVQVRAWWLVTRDALLALDQLDPEIVVAAATLSPETRDVLKLSRVEGLSGETIATSLGISRKLVRGHFRYIVAQFSRGRPS